ncbi:MAG: efflux RND transporter periplasmic adaptor subunit [Desulfomonilaceae bacterium]
MTARLLTFSLLILLLLAGCGTRQDKGLPPPKIKVGVVNVEKGDLRQNLEVTGNLHFIANTTVSAEVSAQVMSIDVRDGQLVKRGQTLLTFDDSMIRAAVDQARGNLQKDEATLAYNKTDWEKNIPLIKTGAISRTTYDQKVSAYQNAKGQVEADKGALAKAQEDLKHTVEIAPIDGVLSSRYVEKGDWVSTGGKLFQISDYTTAYLQTFLSDQDVGKLDIERVIREGTGVAAEVAVDSISGKTFKGKVGYIQPVMNQNRLFEVRIYIDNRDMQLLEGMYARGRILIKRIPDVVRIPIDALLDQVRNNDKNAVVRVGKQSQAQIARIKIGATDKKFAQVLAGLKLGDVVVVEGKEVLSNGQPLETAVTASSRDRAVAEAPKDSRHRDTD